MDRSAQPPAGRPGHDRHGDSTIPGSAGPPATEIPVVWGNLEHLELIGSGRFAWVFRAWEPSLQRHVALKLEKNPSCDPPPPGVSESLAEGRRLARVRHPNLVSVFGAERHDGRAGVWMELVEGSTLRHLIEVNGPLGDHEAARIVAEVCRALCALHGNEIIHRDVSANNVMRETGGRIVLMDLGLGTDTLEDVESRDRMIVGTPGFIAPEVLEGEAATVASDVYGAGALLFFLLSGTVPVGGKSLTELQRVHREGRQRLIHELRPDLPIDFAEILDRALAREPSRRFGTAAALETALARAIGAGPPVPPISDGRATGDRKASPSRFMIYGALTLLMGFAAVMKWGGDLRDRWFGRASDTYRIAAVFQRNDSGKVSPLQPGDRVTPGDAISLDLTVSDSLFVYVVNRDEASNMFLLFPSPKVSPGNPLTPGRHHLPGSLNGQYIDWQVTSAGGAEVYWVIVSRTRPLDLELELFSLPHPQVAYSNPSAGDRNAGDLRGTGAFVSTPAAKISPQLQGILEASAELTPDEEVASGLWSRRLVLENPPSAP